MQTKTKILLPSFLILFVLAFLVIRAFALDISTGVTVLPAPAGIFRLMVAWAIPEKRVGNSGTNDDTSFYLTLRNPSNGAMVWTQPGLLMTDVEGKYLSYIDTEPLVEGNYDVGFKSSAHLTKILKGVTLNSDPTTLNFTNSTISSEKGNLRLVAGDINGDGITPSTAGDDVINSVDLSIIVSELDTDDPTASAYRSNLNQDTTVNSVDLSLLLANLDKEGER